MTKRQTVSRVLRNIHGYKGKVILSLALSAFTVALTLYVPILIGRAVDAILGAGRVDLETVLKALAGIATATLLGAAGQWLQSAVNLDISSGVVRDLRQQAFDKLQRLPLSYIDGHPQGEVVARVVSDAEQLADGLLMGFTQLFSGVLTILGTLIVMLRVDLGISLVVMLITPVSLVVAGFIARRTYDMFAEQSAVRARQAALVDEAVTGQKVIRAFGRERIMGERFREINQCLERCTVKATFFSSITNPATRFVNGLVYAGVGIAGALSALGGGITVGMLICFLSYANQYTKPFNEISGVLAELQSALAGAARLFELLDAPEQEPDGVLELRKARGRVEFDRVHFSYTAKPLIRDFSLGVEEGQRVAIVGPTGCGKTTLINLLMRFYEVKEGAIRVDERDIRAYRRRDLRRNFGMVLQDTWLAEGTVRDNLAFARPDASREEIEAVCRACHCHSFIMRLPKGYDSPIGENGDMLSQGQRQLLCIARVMLVLPPMLILDEATSSIDTRTELLVQDAFARMMKGRTSFIVAHRLSTIRSADLIIAMRDGRIEEAGTHDALLQKGGFYAHLYNSQFAGSGREKNG
ncbi:MAG: ABC transporter ATP-binding protein [Candidatus Excrementavichristensenella sp.]|jgi:ATP-binding cassette subfamily B multidrug efflux pump